MVVRFVFLFAVMFFNLCFLIVVLVCVVNVAECTKEQILILIFLVIMILFFVISLMNVCVLISLFICIAMLSLLGFLIVLILVKLWSLL